MQIIKFKVTKAFADRHEGVSEGDILDGVADGENLEVVVPLVEDAGGFKVPRAVPVTPVDDGEILSA